MMKATDMFSRSVLFWGDATQRALRHACVVIAGVGGLGCVVAEVLVRSGIGKLILIDCKTIDAPDLNRQLLYTANDLGKDKLAVAAKKLRAITRQTVIETLASRIGADDDVADHLRTAHITGAADCLDNFASRFAFARQLPAGCFLVHGGVQHDYGQVVTLIQGGPLTLEKVFANHATAAMPLPISPAAVCAIGSLMAGEIINNLAGTPQLLNTLLIVELADFTMSKQALHE